MPFGLTNKEFIELRLKCLEPFVTIASKANIEQDIVLKKAEEAWSYAVKPLEESLSLTPPLTSKSVESVIKKTQAKT